MYEGNTKMSQMFKEGVNNKTVNQNHILEENIKWFRYKDDSLTNKKVQNGVDWSKNKFVNEDENCISCIIPIVQKDNVICDLKKIKESLKGYHYDETLSPETRFNDVVMSTFCEYNVEIKKSVKYSKTGSNDKEQTLIALFQRKNFNCADECVDKFYKNVLNYQKIQVGKNGSEKFEIEEISGSKSLKIKWHKDVKIQMTNIRIYLFDTGIGFISVFFKCLGSDAFKETQIFDIYSSLYKYNPMKKAIKDLVCTEFATVLMQYDIIEFNTDDNQNKDVYGTSIFANLCFDTKSDMTKSKIPFWFTGKYPLKSGNVSEKPFLLSANTLSDASIEGCCTLCFLDTGNRDLKKYFNRNVRPICQHSFLTYIMVLHQRYFYDKLAKEVIQIDKHNKYETMYLVEDCISKYVGFKNKYLFETVSMVYKYQTMYDKYRKELKITEIDRSISGTMDALHNIAEKLVERKKAFLLATLSAMTVFNVVINLLDKAKTIPCGCDIPWEWKVGASVVVLVLAIIITIFFLPGKINRAIMVKKRRDKNVDKNIK